MSKVNKKSNHINARFISLNSFISEPTTKVDPNKDIVIYGEKNRLPYDLIEYYNNVGIHRAIIERKAKLFIGKGVSFDYSNDATAKKTVDFLANINKYENADELFNKIAIDLFLFGGVYLQIIWEKGGKKIAEIYHTSYEQVRSMKKDKFGYVNNFAINTSETVQQEWKLYTSLKNKNIIEVPAFNTTSNKGKSQIFYIKGYEAGSKNYYSLPDYIGAKKDLNTLQSISDFNNSSIHNGMQPGLTIYYKGPEPSDKEQDEIVEQLKNKYQDTENANKPMVLFIGEDLEIETVITDTSDIADMYKLLEESVINNITVAHQMPKIIVGLSTPGKLGSSKEILESLEMLRDNYIVPIQAEFLATFNKIMRINKLDDIILTAPKPSLMKYKIDIDKHLSDDEIRKYLGYEPRIEETAKDVVEDEIEDNEDTTKIIENHE